MGPGRGPGEFWVRDEHHSSCTHHVLGSVNHKGMEHRATVHSWARAMA